MNKTMTLIGGSMLLLSSNITPADDGAGVANEVRQQTRTQVQGMPAEEGMNQRTELQTRLQSMTEEERALYEKLNSDKKASGDGTGKKHRYGKGDGTGKQHRYGDDAGTGKQHRYGQSNSGSYGSGYGSRGGGGRGRH